MPLAGLQGYYDQACSGAAVAPDDRLHLIRHDIDSPSPASAALSGAGKWHVLDAWCTSFVDTKRPSRRMGGPAVILSASTQEARQGKLQVVEEFLFAAPVSLQRPSRSVSSFRRLTSEERHELEELKVSRFDRKEEADGSSGSWTSWFKGSDGDKANDKVTRSAQDTVPDAIPLPGPLLALPGVTSITNNSYAVGAYRHVMDNKVLAFLLVTPVFSIAAVALRVGLPYFSPSERREDSDDENADKPRSDGGWFTWGARQEPPSDEEEDRKRAAGASSSSWLGGLFGGGRQEGADNEEPSSGEEAPEVGGRRRRRRSSASDVGIHENAGSRENAGNQDGADEEEEEAEDSGLDLDVGGDEEEEGGCETQ
eukprot:TRINITY_DN15022_c0_g1_i2.p1 TRINITY_DN15022_c0_g1~~TRINITY_DN15022_c0_g1_i2.p1  ORF type:complete len:368 (-),score=86.96 TRINITY_DN15022_c0_g1_i2:41-1144(-)